MSALAQITVLVFADDARRDFTRLDRHRLVDYSLLLRVVAHLDLAGNRKILAERMTDETVVGEYPAQVRVAGEDDAEQVEGLALVPVGAGPDAGKRVHHREIVILGKHTQAHAPVVLEREQLRGGGKAPAAPHTLAVGRIVDAAQVHKLSKAKPGVVVQGPRRGDIVGRSHHRGDFAQRL